MAEKRRGLGRGIGALIPQDQQEKPARPIDVFFAGAPAASTAAQPAKAQRAPVKAKRALSTNARVSAAGTAAPNAASAASPDMTAAVTPATARPGAQTIAASPNSGTTGKANRPAPRVTAVSASANDAQRTDKQNIGKQKNDKPAASSAVADNELLPVPGATYGEIPVTQIMPNTQQPRTIFDEDDLQELADSIKEVGVLQPIVVRPLTAPAPDAPQVRYELIMGERRWRAAQRAGLVTIPAIVRHTEDADLLRDALLENLHRTQLNPLEEAAAYQQLLDDFQITQEELSKKIARSRPQISNTLRLLKLPPLVQRRVAAGVLSAGHARALLSLSDPADIERLAQRIVAEGLSVRAVEEIVTLSKEGSAPKAPRAQRVQRYETQLNALALRLGDRWDTRVRVQLGSRKGRITVEFSDLEDLNRILGTLGEPAVAGDD